MIGLPASTRSRLGWTTNATSRSPYRALLFHPVTEGSLLVSLARRLVRGAWSGPACGNVPRRGAALRAALVSEAAAIDLDLERERFGPR